MVAFRIMEKYFQTNTQMNTENLNNDIYLLYIHVFQFVWDKTTNCAG